MNGLFHLADLTLQYEDSFKNLIRVQKIEREFEQACQDLADAAGVSPDDVELIVDEIDPPDGPPFDQPRLRVKAPPEIYTIDVSQSRESSSNNPIGVYVAYDKPIDVYNWQTEQQDEISRGRDQETSGADDRAESRPSAPSKRTGPESPPKQTSGSTTPKPSSSGAGDGKDAPGTIRNGQKRAIEHLANGHDVTLHQVLHHAAAREITPEELGHIDDLSFHEAAEVIQMLQE